MSAEDRTGSDSPTRRPATLDGCRFPALPETYGAALRAAAACILETFEPVGIIATGTIIRGNPDPASDLDIWVIHLAPMRQRIQKFFRGVPAEIFVNPPWVIEGYLADEQANARAITAHMLATGFVVLSADPVVDELREKARSILTQGSTMTDEGIEQARYVAASAFEDATDAAARDPAAARLLLERAVFEIVRCAFLRRRRYVPRNKDLLAALAEIDREGGAIAREFFAATGLDEKLAHAGRLADRIIEARGFFEWASAPDTRHSPDGITAIEHVQLAMPPGAEQAARDFYGGVLGIPEEPKPPELAKRGGAWFERGTLKIHLGVEADFRPARKAHPALSVGDLEKLVARLRAHGVDVIDDDPLEGFLRVYIADPFGNRIELMQRIESK